jgi:peptidoglycan hydrolase-like protein with peptidoglycan-binding domain
VTVNSIRSTIPTSSPKPPTSVGSTPSLRQGSRGEAVRELQKLLAAKGYGIVADGDFGPKTREAVVAFQRSKGLEADGLVGPKTWAALRGSAQNSADVFVGTTQTTASSTTSGVDAKQLEKAKALVKAGGTATAADVDAVAQSMTGLPEKVLDAAKSGDIEVVACRGSVTDYLTDLKGVRPRGWPPGSTWDIVPGLYNPSTDEVVTATIEGRNGSRRVPAKGEGHGSADMVFHELAHGLDDVGALGTGRTANDQAFVSAYEKDRKSMEEHGETYLLQEGEAGREEAYAETFARYFRRDPTLAQELPGMYAYWKKTEADLAKG